VVGNDNIVANRHTLEDGSFLKGSHDPLSRRNMWRQIRYPLTAKPHFSAAGPQKRGDQFE
jgi:hypothetical protein